MVVWLARVVRPRKGVYSGRMVIPTLLIFFSSFTFATPNVKLTCTARELKAQDCHLFSGNYDLRLLKTTLAWNDGTWHTVDPLPLAGEGVEWEKAEFEFLGGRPIIQIWAWDKGVGESRVQSLHWFTADAEKRTLTLLAEGVVRKRTPREGKTPLYDQMESHGIKVVKDGLEWRLGRKTTHLR